MKFGKHLEQTVNEQHPEWKDFAVDYKSMKKLLPKEEECNSYESTDDSDYSSFWEVFERSQADLDHFYENQEAWARVKEASLKQELQTLGHDNICIDDIKDHLLKFRHKVELVQDFLLVNQTAFSKILKKFDKRTLSQVRETKLAEVLESHVYLDGQGMKRYLARVDDMIAELEELQKNQPKAGKKRTFHRRSYSMELLDKTKMALKYVENASPFFSKNPPRILPTFAQSEIRAAENILGKGQFCSVREIRSFDLDPSEEDEARLKMQIDCLREDGTGHYAIKQINEDLSTKDKLAGGIDLAIEAKFLSSMDHPNIIHLCGSGGTSRYFLVLERLIDTSLHDKIYNVWRHQAQKLEGKRRFGIGIVPKETKIARKSLMKEQLRALYNVAKGMKFLHDRDIIHRDLKPGNIGFGIDGTAKIFDFGLVKELQPRDRVGENEFRASGRTGTRKYMAPENILFQPYGTPVDVYGFAITAWETLTSKVPFEGMGAQKHTKFVSEKGGRHPMPRDWPKSLQRMFKSGWAAKPSDRINADEICKILEACVTSE